MHLHSFQDTELKLYSYVNESPGQVVEGLTILRYPKGFRNKGLLVICHSLVEYAPQIWSPYQISLIDAIEGIHRSFTNHLPGFANKSYAERLHLLHLQSLEHRRLLFDLIFCFNIVRGFTALSFNDFFSLSQNTSTRGHTFKLVVPIAKTNTRKYFFSSRIVPIWNSLPQQFVSAPSTAKFKSLITNQ